MCRSAEAPRTPGPSWGTTVETIAPSSEPKLEPVQREQVGDRRGELVGGGAGNGAQAPVAPELLAVEGTEVGLGVADVDREQHAADYQAAIGWPPQWTEAKLYVIPGSHPSRTRDADAGAQGNPLQAGRPDAGDLQGRRCGRMRFPGVTVPALKLDGKRIQGSDGDRTRARPDPARTASLPTDPEKRGEGRGGEALGRRASSSRPRRLSWWAFKREPRADGELLGGRPPRGAGRPRGQDRRRRSSRPPRASTRRPTRTCGPTSRPCPADLDRIDAWITDGVIGGEEPNAADFQIAPSVRLLMSFDDLRPCIERGPRASWRRGSFPTSPAGCRRSSRRSGSPGLRA